MYDAASDTMTFAVCCNHASKMCVCINVYVYVCVYQYISNSLTDPKQKYLLEMNYIQYALVPTCATNWV